ncbi:MAG: GNAT family N-acetyltransferase [Myxococcaceae bacterium]
MRRATASDEPAVTAVLSRAFETDPFANWFIRPDEGRAAGFSEFFRVAFLRLTLPFGEVYVDGGFRGAALWTPPGKWKLGFWKLAVLLPSYLRAIGLARLPKIAPGLDAIQKRHPLEPHYYLLCLGVDPAHQGKGVGSELLRPMLERCDAEGKGAYLETATERNLVLYRRHGFEVSSELTLPAGGPRMWFMWRRPRRS